MGDGGETMVYRRVFWLHPIMAVLDAAIATSEYADLSYSNTTILNIFDAIRYRGYDIGSIISGEVLVGYYLRDLSNLSESEIIQRLLDFVRATEDVRYTEYNISNSEDAATGRELFTIYDLTLEIIEEEEKNDITIFLKYKMNRSWALSRRSDTSQKKYILYQYGTKSRGIFLGLSSDLGTLFCYGGNNEMVISGGRNNNAHTGRWFETSLEKLYEDNINNTFNTYINSTIILTLSIRYDRYDGVYKATLYHNNKIVPDVLDIPLNSSGDIMIHTSEEELIGSGNGSGFGINDINQYGTLFSSSEESHKLSNLQTNNDYPGSPMELTIGSYAFVVKNEEYSDFGLPLDESKIYTNIGLLQETSVIGSNLNYFIFNNKLDYMKNTNSERPRYILSHANEEGLAKKYIILNIPKEHPIAILNSGIDHSIKYNIPNKMIVDDIIYVTADVTYDMTDNVVSSSVIGLLFQEPILDNDIVAYAIWNWGFMRGATYTFDTTQLYEISSDISNVTIYNGDEVLQLLGVSGETSVEIPLDISFGNLKYVITKNDDTPDISGSMTLLYKEIEEDGNNAYYDFYHKTIEIDVYNAFGSVSYYCFHHGYMLDGKYAFISNDNPLINPSITQKSLMQTNSFI